MSHATRSTRRTRSSSPAPPSAWLGARGLLPLVVIVAAGLLTYGNSLAIPFVWDDESAILTNETIRRLWPLSIPLSPPHETPVTGRPLVNLSLGLNYALGGLNSSGYHAWNIGLHLLCALLLYGIVRRALASPALRGSACGASAESIALIAALLWMVHPLTSEVVDYASQRTESTMALFLLLTLYCAIRRGEAAHAWRWEVLAWLACACGMASKEPMLVAPLVVLLYDRALQFESFGEVLRARKRLYGGLALSWLLLAWLMWHGSSATVGFSALSPRTYALNQLQMIVVYLRLWIWPQSLVLDYGVPKALSLQQVAPEAALVIGLLAATLVAIVRWPRAGWLAVVAWLTLAPTSSIVPIATEVGAERRMYVPLMALSALSALAVISGRIVLDRMTARAQGSSRWLHVAAMLGIGFALMALSLRTFYRNKEFQDPVVLWRTVVDRRPGGRAHLGLGMALIAAGKRAEGVTELRTAAGDYAEARGVMGLELFADGRTDEAIAALGRYVGDRPLHPSRIPARVLLGEAFASSGRWVEAIEEFRAVLQQAPHHLVARENLGDALSSLGRFDEAVVEYQTLIAEVKSDRLEVKLGDALAGRERYADATSHYARALELNDSSALAHRRLAEAYGRVRDFDQAVRHAEAALRLEPQDAATENFLGVALASQGRVDDAIQHFRRAVQLKPDDPTARANLSQAMKLAGGVEKRSTSGAP